MVFGNREICGSITENKISNKKTKEIPKNPICLLLFYLLPFHGDSN
jgi:hypothetical protein